MGQDENKTEIQYVVWKPEMSVHSKAIDVQHQQVVSLLNEVNLDLQSHGHTPNMDVLLLRLRIFTETHFAYEETILRLTGYPGLEPHKELHAAMIRKTKEVIAELSGSRDYPALLRFLRDWWIGHIQRADMQYVSWVDKLGL